MLALSSFSLRLFLSNPASLSGLFDSQSVVDKPTLLAASPLLAPSVVGGRTARVREEHASRTYLFVMEATTAMQVRWWPLRCYSSSSSSSCLVSSKLETPHQQEPFSRGRAAYFCTVTTGPKRKNHRKNLYARETRAQPPVQISKRLPKHTTPTPYPQSASYPTSLPCSQASQGPLLRVGITESGPRKRR